MKGYLLPSRRIRRPGNIALILLFAFFSQSLSGQTFSFESSDLIGESINNPTSLQFGPDGRLYVGTKSGDIYAYTIDRNKGTGPATYTVTNTEIIKLIQQQTPNHNDNGTLYTDKDRQITGILVTGTAAQPILYVTSSDPRISVGSDVNLDTNSGVISRLTKTGTGWDKVDIVRGLSRCEENHSVNGLDITPDGSTLYVMVGGNTNKGAPGNNFSGTPEYWTSAALLSVDLTTINSMTVYTDPRTNTKYVYDLPTLNDPTRTDISFGHPEFPYTSATHPMHNATIDIGDPFGGNNGANMAITEPGGPVQIFSAGFRNAYDVVYTAAGKLFTSDNGPNSGWGGLPLVFDAAGNPQGTVDDTPLPNGWYITNEFNETGSNKHGDVLYNIKGQGYYGGHPAPIRAFPSKANIIIYEKVGGVWTAIDEYNFADLLGGVSGYFTSSLNIGMFPDKPAEALYQAYDLSLPGQIDVVEASTNGIVEYTASNFNGGMQGNILTASFDHNIYRYKIAPSGDNYLEKEVLFNGFGLQPLDVTAQGDDDVFPGTIWVATFNSDNITVFEPIDFGDCPQLGDPDYDSDMVDTDNDGYSNADEVANGTNICSAGSTPPDNDSDNLSDLLDDDDDNDGILDVNDAFAIDASNGMNTTVPAVFPFWNDDPGTGFFGVGFTGLMTNGSTDYLDQFNTDFMAFGGAAGKVSIEEVPAGDAYDNINTQDYGFQFGINNSSAPFTIHSKLETPFFADPTTGNAATPQDFQSFGIFIGTGDQDNYLKIVFNANGGSGGIQVLKEASGTSPSGNTFGIGGLLTSDALDLYLTCDPATNTVQPFISEDGGITINQVGNPVSVPSSWMNPNDSQALAVGIIATSRGSGAPFTAIWDFINVLEENLMANLVPENSPVDFGQVVDGTATVTQELRVLNEGGPGAGSIEITNISFTGPDNSEFSYNGSLPLTVGPGGTTDISLSFNAGAVGQKTANIVLAHSGDNSPLIVPIQATVIENLVVLYRFNTGGATIPSIDGGQDWEGGTLETQYLVAGGDRTNGFNINTFDASVDLNSTPTDIFLTERWDPGFGAEMKYSFPVDISELYEVRLYFGNGSGNHSMVGDRIFDVIIEGQLYIDDLDLIATYGHLTGGMQSFLINVTDGSIDIEFIHQIANNPLINGIEILGPGGAVPTPIVVNPIPDQSSQEGETADGPTVIASGGAEGANLIFSASGLPPNLDIEPTNGLIFGTIASGAASGSPYTVTITVSSEDPSDVPVEETFTWTVTAPTNSPEATVAITPGNSDINTSTNNANSFQISNNSPSGQKISSVTFDLSSNMLPEIVFDPDGTAGDLAAKGFTEDSNGGTGTVGHSFGQPYGNGGYRQLDITFTDFEPGETMQFSIDIDPTSIEGLSSPGPGNSGSISGLELAGTAVTVTFDDGTIYTNALYTDGSNGGALSSLREDVSSAPVLAAVGLSSLATVSTAAQTLTVSGGPAYATVSLLQVEGAFFEGGNNLMQTPFEANSAIAVSSTTNITLDGSGEVNIPVTLTDSDPEGGYNYFIAVIEDGSDFGLVSNPIVLEYDAGTPPPPSSTTVLYRINVGGPNVNAADDSSPQWSIDNSGSPSPYRVEGGEGLYNGNSGSAYTGPINMAHASIPASAPEILFNTQRFDKAPAPNMKWEFPVTPGTEVEVRLFFCELFSQMDMPGERLFDVSVEGSVPPVFDDIDGFVEAGPKGAFMRSHTLIVADATLDLEFIHLMIQNPSIQGIEILAIGTSGNNNPMVVNPGDQSSQEEEVVSLQISAIDDSDNLTYSATGLPANLSIDPFTGLISGTIGVGESANSPYSVAVTVTDDGTPTGSTTINFSWTIGNENPMVDNPGDQSSQEEEVVSLQINATDDSPNLTYSATGLPANLSIDPLTGLISGTIGVGESANSPYSVAVTVTDDGTPTGSTTVNFSWTVEPSNENPMVDNPGNQSSQEEEVVSLQINATDDSPSLTYSATGLPANLSIDPLTGLISGTIGVGESANSPYSVAVTVTDDGTPTGSTTVNFTWTVTPVGQSAAVLDGSIGNTTCEGRNLTIWLYEVGTTNLVLTQAVQLGTNGSFGLTDIPSGTYDVFVKLDNSLKKKNTLTFTGGESTIGDFGELIMGDCNNDNLVTTADFTILGATMNKQEGDDGYNGLADFNCDGAVTTADFTILGGTINTTGDEPGGI